MDGGLDKLHLCIKASTALAAGGGAAFALAAPGTVPRFVGFAVLVHFTLVLAVLLVVAALARWLGDEAGQSDHTASGAGSIRTTTASAGSSDLADPFFPAA